MMEDRGVRCFSFHLIAFGLLLFIPIDTVIVQARGLCEFNGKGYISNQIITFLPETCTSFMCQERSNGVLSIRARTMDSCRCEVSPEVSPKLRYPLYLKDKHTHEDLVEVDAGLPLLKSGAPSDRCSFNGAIFEMRETVASYPERCFDLICVQGEERSAVIQARVNQSCACSGLDGPIPPAADYNGTMETRDTQHYTCELYETYHQHHTMCLPPNPNCEIIYSQVTEAEKEKILLLHNKQRQMVALGRELLGHPGPQPPAANMRELVWNEELAEVAQAWANQCPYRHDCYGCRKLSERDYYVGQNMFWSFGYTIQEVWENAINHFYTEVKDLPNERVEAFGPAMNGKTIAHYTQLVWGKTFEIGCGVIYNPCYYKGNFYPVCSTYVCNYGPAGNIRNRPMYQIGEPASNCPYGKSEQYDGLCK